MAVLGYSGMDEETAAQGPAQSSSLSQAGQKGPLSHLSPRKRSWRGDAVGGAVGP